MLYHAFNIPFGKLDVFHSLISSFYSQFMKQTVAEKQQHVNKLNRIAPELAKLSPGAGAQGVQAKADDDNRRYENVKEDVNKRGEKMFDLLQRTSSVSNVCFDYCYDVHSIFAIG